MNIAQNAAIAKSLPEITDKTTLGEAITILGLKPGQKKKGKTPTRLKLTTSEEPLVQIHGSTLYARRKHLKLSILTILRRSSPLMICRGILSRSSQRRRKSLS